MEQDKKKKRVRGEEDESQNEIAKRRGMNLEKEVEEKEGCSSSEPEEALGVFDFPWLKDGVTFKTEDYLLGFEDNFSSSLEKQDIAAAGVDFSSSMIHVPEAKLEDDVWNPIEGGTLELETENVDYIWSSLLKQPL